MIKVIREQDPLKQGLKPEPTGTPFRDIPYS